MLPDHSPTLHVANPTPRLANEGRQGQGIPEPDLHKPLPALPAENGAAARRSPGQDFNPQTIQYLGTDRYLGGLHRQGSLQVTNHSPEEIAEIRREQAQNNLAAARSRIQEQARALGRPVPKSPE